MTDKIKIVVTQEKFDEIFSIDDWFNFDKMPQKEVYGLMLQFVADEAGNALSIEDARKQFKKVPKSEWIECISDFVKAIEDAFVNPTSGSS
jgi:hypothetical protein